MRSQNIKNNSAGKVIGASCLTLLLFTFLVINPISNSSAYAEGGEAAGGGDVITFSEAPSTVNIAFLPTSATGSVTPVNSGGDKAKVDVKATVRVQNSGGYSVYVGSTSSALKNGSNEIPSVDTVTTYANMPVNTWGYAFLKNGATSTDTTTYDAMPATLRSTALDANTNTNITDETRTYTLSFAANIGADKPAGTYTNSVTMSVVSSPLVVAEEITYDFGGITDMQEMTTAICDAAPTGGVKQLRDSRDGKYYWIGKMKDGKCWMTQNLDLDLSKNRILTSDDSDVKEGWVPEYDTATAVNADTILNSTTGQRSWSLGDYSIMNPTDFTSCGSGLESALACVGSGTADRFKYYTTPTTANGDANAHYILGNHYQWNAATAGTGGTITEGQAESSICPKGWKLPESGKDVEGNDITTAGSFGGLVDAYEIGSSAAKLTSAPLYFVRGGDVGQLIDTLFQGAGYYGIYWSSTPNSSSSVHVYNLYFYGTSNVDPSYAISRRVGRSVRCIAK